MEAFLVGRCGMNCEQAGWVSFHEYELRRKGYEEKEREDWTKRRWELFILMQMHPNIKTHNKPTTPELWIPFAWEKAVEPQRADAHISAEDVDKLTAIFAQRIK